MMFYNDENIGISKVEAFYGYFIKVISKDFKKSIVLGLKPEKYDFNKEENETLKKLKINTDISFDYNYKTEKSTEMINKKLNYHHFSLTDILEKL